MIAELNDVAMQVNNGDPRMQRPGDRVCLEHIAKSFGWKTTFLQGTNRWGIQIHLAPTLTALWNPILDGDQALELALLKGINVNHTDEGTVVSRPGCEKVATIPRSGPSMAEFSDYKTRVQRAIVRLAWMMEGVL